VAAVEAAAVEEDLVGVELEAAGGEGLQVAGTSFDVEDAAAVVAVEVVVMAPAGDLVAGRLAGDVDGVDVAFGDEAFERAIDGSVAQRRDVGLRGGQDLAGAQRAGGAFEDGADGRALARLQLHAVDLDNV
jgi:hypothetical protein